MRTGVPSRIALLVPAIACLAVSIVMGVLLSRQMREDLYWTPVEEAPALAEARPRAEVMVDGTLLQDLSAAGRLRVDGRAVGPDELRVRFNNRDAVTRAQMIVLAAAAAAGIAFLTASFLVGGRRPTPKDVAARNPAA